MNRLPAQALIGMVHLRALPGTPWARLGVREIVAIARRQAGVLREAGFDALLVENMHDAPYLKRAVGPEIVAAMTAATAAVVEEARGLPVGVQVLAGANREALAVALAAGAGFIRAEGFVFAHVADEGIMESDAGELLRYRRAIGAEGLAVFADIKKKHSSHAITADVSLEETARAAAFFGSDGVIVTGPATGSAAKLEDVREVCRLGLVAEQRRERDGEEVSANAGTDGASKLRVLVGSGATAQNIGEIWKAGADGVVVGSSLKKERNWTNEIDEGRCVEFVKAARG